MVLCVSSTVTGVEELSGGRLADSVERRVSHVVASDTRAGAHTHTDIHFHHTHKLSSTLKHTHTHTHTQREREGLSYCVLLSESGVNRV